MVLKRQKVHKRQTKLAARERDTSLSNLYQPPARDSLQAEEWIEALDGMLFRVYAWYFKKKGQSGVRKLADFHIQVVQAFQSNTEVGQLIASADCLHHGTLHFHDEVADPEHKTRKDILPLTAPTDVEIAFVQVYGPLKAFAARIIAREREGGCRE